MEQEIIIRRPLDKIPGISFGFGTKPQTKELKNKYKEWGLIGHNGIDFEVKEGTQVFACDEGQVIQSGVNNDFGISITIKHRWGQSIYAHLLISIVSKGQNVIKGASIGLSGKSGYVTGPHLHFGIKPNNANDRDGYNGFIDPTGLFENPIKSPIVAPFENIVVKEVIKKIPTSPETVDKLANEKLQQLLRDLKTKADAKRKENRDKRMTKIIDHLEKNATITNRQIRTITDVSEMTAINYLRQLVAQHKIEKLNKGRSVSYILKK